MFREYRPALQAFAVVLFALAVVALGRWAPNFLVFELIFVGVYAIAILGLVILTGYSGQISLGHGAFMAVGGYTVAILADRAGVPYWLSVPLGGLVCGALGFALGFVALRLAGIYLALATFALAISLPSLLKHFKRITGGVEGISLPAAGSEHWLYYVTWAVVALAFALAWLALRGRIGRSLRAIRDSQVAAVSFGVNPVFYKTLAFGWSAAYAGIAGALLAIATRFVSPDVYGFNLSLTLLVGAVLGGLDAMWGAILGAGVIEFLPLWAQKVNAAASSVVYGVALVLVMLFAPGGIASWARASLTRRPGFDFRRRPNTLTTEGEQT